MTSKGVTGEGKAACIQKRVEWEIKISTLSTVVGEWYRNDYFRFADEEWCLIIYAGGNNKEAKGCISVYLRPSDNFNSECNIKFAFGLKKANGCLENILKEIDHTFKEPGSDFGYHKFFQKSELLKRKSDLLPNGILTVVCILKQVDRPNVTPKLRTMNLREIEKLSMNFKDLLFDKKSCDLTLEVKGKLFEVHKAVLIARSSVFSAMFEHEMLEKGTGTVVIPDCDEQSFGLFLEYLYSGVVNDISFNSALRLYPTTHKYDTPELKSFCLQYLTKNLTVENFIDIAILADQYDETELMCATEDFFSRNLKKVVSTESWESLMKENYRLANKLIVGMSSKVKCRDEFIDSDEN